MRKTIKFVSLFTFCQILNFSTFSQNSLLNNLRNIEVTGSSEMSIKPDEIQIDFTIKEYYTKGTKEKFNLATAEKEFFTILGKYGLKEKDIILDNSIYSSNWYSWWKSKKEEFKYEK